MSAPSDVPTLIPERAAALIAELHAEADATRRVLSRVPEEQLGWRPHPKSMSLGTLALHLAQLPWGIAMLAEQPVTELPTVPLIEAISRAELLETLERNLAFATEHLDGWGDAGLAEPWTLTIGGQPIMTMPRGALLRTLMMNHAYHHRGQLTVYLRLLDVPLPPVYGPTADENPLA